MRLRNFFVMKSVLDGGVSDPQHIPPELLKEMYLAATGRGHYRAFLSLLRNAETWETATKAYSNIKFPCSCSGAIAIGRGQMNENKTARSCPAPKWRRWRRLGIFYRSTGPMRSSSICSPFRRRSLGRLRHEGLPIGVAFVWTHFPEAARLGLGPSDFNCPRGNQC